VVPQFLRPGPREVEESPLGRDLLKDLRSKSNGTPHAIQAFNDACASSETTSACSSTGLYPSHSLVDIFDTFSPRVVFHPPIPERICDPSHSYRHMKRRVRALCRKATQTFMDLLYFSGSSIISAFKFPPSGGDRIVFEMGIPSRRYRAVDASDFLVL
jgi:hypothetical protein